MGLLNCLKQAMPCIFGNQTPQGHESLLNEAAQKDDFEHSDKILKQTVVKPQQAKTKVVQMIQSLTNPSTNYIKI
ncbi:MAG TPA: hypothetical protein QF353_07185 [Gammaproteobacteria bacterium]|nr:hypothetical protein [Gammaproteobacteria bacterium]